MTGEYMRTVRYITALAHLNIVAGRVEANSRVLV